MPPIKLQVLSDFDGTITVTDTVDVLLNKLADPAWEDIEAEWEQGKIGSRECMSRQIPLIRGGWAAIQNELDQMEIAAGFNEFVNWCRQKNIPISVVSDGLDRVIAYLLKRHGVQVDRIYANHLIESADGSLSLQFSNGPRLMQCQSGVCKCQIANNVSSLTTKVVIGDGRSDFCWAKEADILFAKSKLIEFCREEKLAYNPFSNFVDIQCSLDSLLEGKQEALVFKAPVTITVLPVVTPNPVTI